MSNEQRLDKAFGFGMGYARQLGKKSELVLSGIYKKKQSEFDQISNTYIFPGDISIAKRSSNSQHISFRLNYQYALIENNEACLSIGPEVSYNVFSGEDNNKYLTVNDSIYYLPSSNENDKIDKLGIAFLIKFEIKHILTDNLSLNIHIRPEKLYSESYEGAIKPYSGEMSNIEFGLGLKYNFK